VAPVTRSTPRRVDADLVMELIVMAMPGSERYGREAE
jgi:hypothetical protein